MRAWVVLVIYIVLISLVIYFVWQNRASERILSTVLPIPTAALIGILLFLTFGQAEPTSAVISTVFLLDSKTNLPLSLIGRDRSFTASLMPAELQKQDHQAFVGTERSLLYGHVLQAAIVDELGFYFRSTWLPKIDRLRSGFATTTQFGGPGPDGDKLDAKRLDELLSGNLLVGIHPVFPPQLTLPKNTRVEIQAPTDKTSGTVRFVKPGYFDVKIETSFNGGGVGLGSYGLFFRESQGELQNLYWNSAYTIRVTATFSGFRSGHPDIPDYRAWVNTIVDVLRNSFDEDQIWSQFKELQQLRMQTGKHI